MTTDNPSKIQLIDTIDEMDRARALLHAAAIVTEGAGDQRPQQDRDERTRRARHLLNAAEDILGREGQTRAFGNDSTGRQAGPVAEGNEPDRRLSYSAGHSARH